MSRFQQSVDGIGAYVVDQDASLIKLNQNESSRDVPAALKEEIFERLRRTSWNRYPIDGSGALEEKIAAYTGHPVSGILAGNGSNELIQTLFVAACSKGDRVVTARPSFSVYKRVAGLLGVVLDEIPLGLRFAYDADEVIRRAKCARMVILAVPNNPTGTTISEKDLERIARATDGLLVIDEAYQEFQGTNAQSLLSRYENVVILRTMSKAWRLAGARLGYLLGREETARALSKAKLPFSVDVFARTVTEAVLERRDLMDEVVRTVRSERERLFREMEGIPALAPVPSAANFILFEVKNRPARSFFQALRDKGVLVRVYDEPDLRNYLRVTIGDPAENDAFLAAVREIAGGERA
jgi:histidinol-phosphate aminotransferase